jgi:hypothetical protein
MYVDVILAPVTKAPVMKMGLKWDYIKADKVFRDVLFFITLS